MSRGNVRKHTQYLCDVQIAAKFEGNSIRPVRAKVRYGFQPRSTEP
jgi:hypothetical protein